MTSDKSKRIAKNTLMLYIRMLVSMLVSLYTSRVVLATLGESDFGIYNVVGGVVAMMGFLNASLSGASSRYITYELAGGNPEKTRHVFSVIMAIHIGLALIILLFGETVGLWFLEKELNIPAERMWAARWVFQFSLCSTVLGISSFFAVCAMSCLSVLTVVYRVGCTKEERRIVQDKMRALKGKLKNGRR